MGFAGRLVRGSLLRVAGTVATLGVSFFMMPFVIRTFGDHWYGLWVIAAGMGNYYYLLDFGLASAASRYVTVKVASNDERGVNEAVSTAFVIFGILGLGVAIATLVACYIAGAFARPEDVPTLRTIILLQGLGLAIGFPVKAYGGLVFSQLRYDLVEFFNLFKIAGETAVVVWALTHGYGLIAYALIGVVFSQLFNVFFYVLARKLWPPLRVSLGAFRRDLTREMFGYSFWTVVNQVGDNVRFKVDSLVIAGFGGASLVTHFNVGARLAEYTLTLVNRATNFITPLYTRYHAQGNIEEIQAKLIIFTRINALLAFCGGGVLIVLGDAFIVHWMGAPYRDAYPVLVALVIGLMAEAILQPVGNVLWAVAKHRTYALAGIVESVANLGLSIFLYKRMGIVGVALGTTIPLLINKLIFMPLYVCHIIKMRPSRYYLAFAPAFVMTASALSIYYLIVGPYLAAPGYTALAMAAITPMLILAVLAFVFVLGREEKAFLTRLMATGYGRLRGEHA